MCMCVYVSAWSQFGAACESNLCSKVMAGRQVLEPEEAVPVACPPSAGIMLNNLKYPQTSAEFPKAINHMLNDQPLFT